MTIINYFCKKLHLRYFARFWIRLWKLLLVMFFDWQKVVRANHAHHITRFSKKPSWKFRNRKLNRSKQKQKVYVCTKDKRISAVSYTILCGIYLFKDSNENSRKIVKNLFKVNNKETRTTSTTVIRKREN